MDDIILQTAIVGIIQTTQITGDIDLIRLAGMNGRAEQGPSASNAALEKLSGLSVVYNRQQKPGSTQ